VGRVVLFGGRDGTGPLGDTWELDEAGWSPQTLGTAPPARYRAAVTYDGGMRAVLLFGGADGPLADLWIYRYQ